MATGRDAQDKVVLIDDLLDHLVSVQQVVFGKALLLAKCRSTGHDR